MENFITYCKGYIADHIGCYEGQKIDASELSWTLTEGPNMDGTLTYSREEAIDYLKEWWVDAADYWEYEKAEFGRHFFNPFERTESYMVCMVIEGVNTLVSDALSEMNIDWESEVEVTPEFIEDLIEKVYGNNRVSLF